MSKVSLLIADDEDMIRNGIAKYIKLHSDRYDPIYLASDGAEASEIIFRHKPDLLMLDIQMPLKNGIEVMQEAADAGILPITVILSGYDEFQYAQKAMRCGAKDYLLKPVRSTDILKKLDELSRELSDAPEGISTSSIPEPGHAIVRRAKRYMEENYYKELTLDQAASYVGITAGYLSTLFTKNLGIGFVECLNRIRVEHACAYLTQHQLKTYEIAYKVGFKDEKYFSKVFHRITGETPSGYKKTHVLD